MPIEDVPTLEFSRMDTIWEETPEQLEIPEPWTPETFAMLQNFLAAYPNGFIPETCAQQAAREGEMLDVSHIYAAQHVNHD